MTVKRLPVLMSFNAGAVDTVGFLLLAGLLPAHVTGNFVTLGASLATGVTSKLLSLPVFCAVVVLARLAADVMRDRGKPGLRPMLLVHLALLTVATVLAVRNGPFPNADATVALTTGMMLVASMAVQNAIQRLYMASLPPTTIMTGTTTQIMLDLGVMLRGRVDEDRALRGRMAGMAANVAAFAFGCGTAALLCGAVGPWSLVAPLLGAALLTFLAGEATPT